MKSTFKFLGNETREDVTKIMTSRKSYNMLSYDKIVH